MLVSSEIFGFIHKTFIVRNNFCSILLPNLDLYSEDMACSDQTVSGSENTDEDEWHQASDFYDSAYDSKESQESYVEPDEEQPIKGRSNWKSHDAVEFRAALPVRPDSAEHRIDRARANQFASSSPQRNKNLRYNFGHLCIFFEVIFTCYSAKPFGNVESFFSCK